MDFDFIFFFCRNKRLVYKTATYKNFIHRRTAVAATKYLTHRAWRGLVQLTSLSAMLIHLLIFFLAGNNINKVGD